MTPSKVEYFLEWKRRKTTWWERSEFGDPSEQECLEYAERLFKTMEKPREVRIIEVTTTEKAIKVDMP